MFDCQNIFLLILIYYIKILFTKFVNMQLLQHNTFLINDNLFVYI
jgi:hypothetical protein